MVKNWKNELLHYIVVYGVLLLIWTPLMDYFAADLVKTALGGFAAFVMADQILHRVLGL